MMHRFLLKWIKNERGVAFIEFAFVFPFMFLLVFGAIEVTRYILITQKVEKAAYVLTDIVTQYNPSVYPSANTTPAQIAAEISIPNLNNDVFAHFDAMMEPYGGTANENVVFSSVQHRAAGGGKSATNLLRWQQWSNVGGYKGGDVVSVVNGNGAGSNFSRLPGQQCGPAPMNAALTNGMSTAYPNENIVIGEVFYSYQPIVGVMLGVTTATQYMGGGPFSLTPRTIMRRIVMHPRITTSTNAGLLSLPPNTPYADPTKGQVDDCPNQ